MTQPSKAGRLVEEIRSRLALLPSATTASIRRLRQEFSRQIAEAGPDLVLRSALLLLKDSKTDVLRFVAYELVRHHRTTFENLRTPDLLKLGEGINSWGSVDCFAMYLSGPAWRDGRLSDRTIRAWTRSKDRWWRRAALVSTVALSRRGDADDIHRVVEICTRRIEDRDDMVVKAVSWALRELAKKHPTQARRFIAEHRSSLAARVIREVENKLTTGLKTPHRQPFRKSS